MTRNDVFQVWKVSTDKYGYQVCSPITKYECKRPFFFKFKYVHHLTQTGRLWGPLSKSKVKNVSVVKCKYKKVALQ